MAFPSGISAQLGYKAETVVGTAVTVDTFLPLVSESIKRTENFLESAGIIAGKRFLTSNQWNAGTVDIEGSIGLELMTHDMDGLFLALLGSKTGSGTSGAPWVFTPASTIGKSLTIQVGRPAIDGTVHPFTYAGCKIVKAQIELQADSIATLGLDIVGSVTDETTATALATASYTSGIKPFKFTHGTVTIAGSSANVKQITIDIDQNLDTSRRFIGNAKIAEPLPSDLMSCTGSMMLEFDALTNYARIAAHTEADVVLTLTNTVQSIVIDMHCRFDGETPTVSGRGILEQPLSFTAVADSTTDGSALTITVIESA